MQRPYHTLTLRTQRETQLIHVHVVIGSGAAVGTLFQFSTIVRSRLFCERAAPAWWAARLSDAGARGATRRAAARSLPFRTGRVRRRATSAAHLRGLQVGEVHLHELGLVREGLRRGVADLLAEAARVLARSTQLLEQRLRRQLLGALGPRSCGGFESGCDECTSRLVGVGFSSASASASAGAGGAPPPPALPRRSHAGQSLASSWRAAEGCRDARAGSAA